MNIIKVLLITIAIFGSLIIFAIIFRNILLILCRKKGHKYKNKNKLIRMESNKCRIICVDCEAKIPTCVRCGKTKEPIIGEEIDWYNSVEMDNEDWRKMKKQGYLIL